MYLALAALLPLVFLFWTLSSTTTSPFAHSFPRVRNKRICLLIAHPDDEAMFFAPTVLALTKPDLGNHLKILCLSTGNADGLGPIRKKELVQSALHLGVRNESDVFVVDDPKFQDSMLRMWKESDVSALLASAFAPEMIGASDPTLNPNSTPTIDVLLTFDQHGVSNHPNHRSLYHGAVHFIRSLGKGKEGLACPVSLYTLTTTNILRKYAGVLDAPVTMFIGAVKGIASSGVKQRGNGNPEFPPRLLFVSSVAEWLHAQSAMVKAHQSQMVWFRWGWITIGRYMTVNDLKREGI
ncbi:hypothetical protein ASPZODRAFT_55518 [Penicilliopsis zonata CBS 506.65]|uniref:N-acetylglucosaminylphosphatidylinositol deacetylase n=1 Tax=Penicilliopsis zonata CBS 506.65 TaxID=1073090 RepID=A0A1L9SUU8_9EURO|nr:hypothetical protein ASPZODRAFT_55518 [Penicilliopsis zonata CBS 506.65]OJJ51000.1 hypothetical protein ASPZODRAFT_55518 [Penicilliopsis zonata CBS 506.65]